MYLLGYVGKRSYDGPVGEDGSTFLEGALKAIIRNGASRNHRKQFELISK